MPDAALYPIESTDSQSTCIKMKSEHFLAAALRQKLPGWKGWPDHKKQRPKLFFCCGASKTRSEFWGSQAFSCEGCKVPKSRKESPKQACSVSRLDTD